MAQDSDTIYTRVAWWQVPRTKWQAFVELFEKAQKPVLDRMLNSGVLEDYGFDAVSLHHPEGYTHSVWFSAKSLAGLEQTLDAFQEAASASGTNLPNEIAGLVTKHRDDIFRSIFHGAKSVKLDDGYFMGSMNQVKPGRNREYREIWEANVKPVYEQLLSAGTISAYGLDTQFIHTEEPGSMMSWYIIPNIEADEKVGDAFDAAWEKVSEADRDARQAKFRSLTERSGHRDDMTRIIYYAHK
jgi:hypothetical protein